MATTARDRLARTLAGQVKSASCVELTTALDDLSLHVEGIGRVQFPLTPTKVRKLIGFGQPARFGRGAETLTDPDVRDTWEIPKQLVSAVWNDASLTDILATVKDELGLPHRAELTADLHSLLVYEPNQFFLAHQDSEKDDSMIGTLVVTLPSTYTGGELIVGRDAELKAYRGSRAALSLVAFYADCRHEVLRVKSGYRITLTYNLLLRGDTSRPEGDAGTITELADLLREHFSTPAPRYHWGPATDTPNRLVYLLDHEYTPRALSWGRLKGADADRVSLLRAAANDARCETILALADIRTQHGASADDDESGYRGGYWGDDPYGDDDDDDAPDGEPQNLEIHELIDSEVALTHWTGPNGARLEETSLSVAVGEVCASTPTDVLTPSDSQYEGYMGNWGNTLDRWYHRAAVVVWPRALAFANRAETSPVWALEQLTAMASTGDVPGARASATTLTPFWDATVRSRLSGDGGGTSELFEATLHAGHAVADQASATMLLRPFGVENLTAAAVSSFAAITSAYGQRWAMELLGTWFDEARPAWLYGGGERPRWMAEWLPSVCAGLHAAGDAGTVAAQHLLDLAWQWTEKAIRSAFGESLPSQRDQQLTALGEPLAALLSAAAAIGAASTVDTITHHVRKQDDAVAALEMSALRAARTIAGFSVLAEDCTPRLRARLDRPFRDHDDWSIELPADGCTCELCVVLCRFLTDPGRRTFEWPLAEQRRRHVHSRIDGAELPVTHVTRRQGRPYTLVLAKTDALFTADLQSRASAAADLEWLAATWPSTL
jgi:hypothetical protein